jgi:hypothetical protein
MTQSFVTLSQIKPCALADPALDDLEASRKGLV